MSTGLAYGAPLRIQEVKAAGEAWECAGYCSTFGNVDLGGDVIHKGAFAATLASGQKTRFLFNHDAGQVLGTAVALKEDDRGLFGKFRISRTPLGETVHTLLKDGALDSFSVGYYPTEYTFDDDGIRHLKAIDLVETSVVAMPMNPQALVTGVKAADYAKMRLDAILDDYDGHRTAALAAAKALAARRRAEGRKLSDRVVALLERLRQGSLADADALLALLTDPLPERERVEVTTGTATPAAAKAAPGPEPDAAADPEADAGAPPPDADPDPESAPQTPVAVKTAGLVEAHLRRARLKAKQRRFADVALPPDDPLTRLERLPVPAAPEDHEQP